MRRSSRRRILAEQTEPVRRRVALKMLPEEKTSEELQIRFLAESHHLRALEIRRTALSPDHPDVASSQYNLGRVRWARGDLEGARVKFGDALETSRALHDLDPSNNRRALDLAIRLTSLASLFEALGTEEKALAMREESLRITERLHEQSPADISSAGDLAWDLLATGALVRKLGNANRAQELFARSAEVLQPFDGSGDFSAPHRETFVRALLELGRVDEARPHVDRLDESGWHLRSPDRHFLDMAGRHRLLPLEEGR